MPSLVNGTCRSKKGKFGELVAHAQVWWPYIVAHLDQTPIFKLYRTRLKFQNNYQKDMCIAEIWTMCTKYTQYSRLNC